MSQVDSEHLERQIREGFELTFKERLLTMKNIYEMRYETLHQTLKQSYKKVLEDQLLKTLIADKVSSAYTESRVKEIFQEIVSNEREFVIEKIGLQFSELKFNYQELQNKHTVLVNDRKALQESSRSDQMKYEAERYELIESLRKKEQQIYELRLELQTRDTQLRQQGQQIEKTESELKNSSEEKEFLCVKLQRFEQQITSAIGENQAKFELKDVDLQDSQRKVSLLEAKLRDIEKVNQEKVQLLEKKYRKKVAEYKNKIEEHKAKIIALVQEKREHDPADSHFRVAQLERKLLSATREHERKIAEFRSSKDKEKFELQKKYETRYKDLQIYYQNLLNEKIEQLERNAREAIEKITAEEYEIKKYIDFLENNSTPMEEHNKVTQYFEQILKGQEDKLSEAADYIEELSQENKRLQQSADRLRELEHEHGKYKSEMQTTVSENKRKLTACEKQLMTFQQMERKVKSHLSDNQALINQKTQEAEELKSHLMNLEQEKTELLRILEKKNQQIEAIEQELNSTQQSLTKSQKGYQQSQESALQLKTQLSEKNSRLSLAIQEQEYTIKNLRNQLKISTSSEEFNAAKIKEWEEKYSSLCRENSVVEKEKLSLQSVVYKLELENSFIKENESTVRNQLEVLSKDSTAKLEQRNQKIQNLEEQLAKKGSHSDAEAVTLNRKCQRYRQICQQLRNSVIKQCSNLKRMLSSELTHYVASATKLFSNECQVLASSLVISIKERINQVVISKQGEIKGVSAQHEHERTLLHEENRKKVQVIESHCQQQIQSLERHHEEVKRNKDIEIEGLERQRKKQVAEIEQLNDKLRKEQKRVQQYSILIENEKNKGTNKISEIVRNFNEQKENILNEYESKRSQQEQQMQNVLQDLAKIKSDDHIYKAKTQEEKQKLQLQIDKAVQKNHSMNIELAKRDSEIEHLRKGITTLEEGNKKMETELKKYYERNNNLSSLHSELQLGRDKLTGEITILKNKVERLKEENEELKREMEKGQTECEHLSAAKDKMESELNELKAALSKTMKSQDTRALQHLNMHTKSLTSKVEELKRVSYMMDDKTPLRS